MSAECERCGHDLPFEGDCQWCELQTHAAADTALLEALREHIEELEDAWMRGAIVEHDGKGGTRSNRNADLGVRLKKRLEAA